MSRRKISSVLPLAVVSLAVVALGAIRGAHAVDATAGPSALVTVTQLKQGALPSVLRTFGAVEASNTGFQSIMAQGPAIVGRIDTHLGAEVRAGAALLTLMPSPESAAAYQQAKSSLRVAEGLVRSTRRLLSLHLATQQQLAEAEKAQNDASANLRALETAAAAGPTVIRAPFAAVVTTLSVRSGDLVSAGAAVLTLASPSRLVLAAGVVPGLARRIHIGDDATVKANGSDQWLTGHVSACGAAIDPNTGLVPVRIALPPGQFMPGEFAEARITTEHVHGYVVPHEAVLINDSGATYVVQAVNGVAHKVPVRVLAADGDENVIAGALDPRAALVLTGNYQLDDNMKIRLAGSAGSGAAQ